MNMENKIPTAKEFLWNGAIITQGDTEPYGRLPNDKVPLVMIEFAKLHVEMALKEASDKAKIKYDYSGNTGSEYCDEYVDPNSILNAYSLTNIK